jgi:hypothetical protein
MNIQSIKSKNSPTEINHYSHRLPTYQANLTTGIAGILVMGLGIFGSGWVIRKREPSGRSVAWWVCGAAGVYASGIFLLIFVGCGDKGNEEWVGLSGGIIGG